MREDNTIVTAQSVRMDPYHILLSVFIACLVIAQLLAAKLTAIHIPLFGNLVFPSGVLAYALTYLCTDVISEVYGKKLASQTIIFGLIANVTILLLIRIAVILPPEPSWYLTDAFNSIADSITRVTIASMAAYLVSQYHDVWLFHLLKRLTKQRFLWLRNTLSTTVSQLIDTVIFILIVFYGQMEMKGIMALITGQFIVKAFIAVADTPFIYLTVWFIDRRRDRYSV